jgi:hypothetical protein
MSGPRSTVGAEIRIETFGVRILVRVGTRSLAARVRSRLPASSRAAAFRRPDASYHVAVRRSRLPRGQGASPIGDLFRGGRPLLTGVPPEALLDALESDLELFVAERARRVVFIHAGAVGWRGRAILLPGSSGSGKTTLVAAFVRAGAVYLSDEYAVLDAHGRVHPFSRRPKIRDADGASRRVPVRAIGGRVNRRPLRPGHMLALVYRTGSARRLDALSPAQAAIALLQHTVAARARPRAALTALARVARTVSAWRGERGEAEAFAAAFLSGRLTGLGG